MMVVDISEIERRAKETFGRNTRRYDEQSRPFLAENLMAEANYFLNNIPGSRILDVGSGPGRDSAYFKQQGFQPLCIDLAPEMVEICKEKGLEARVMSFMDMSKIPAGSFDGVWSYVALNLIPKSELPKVLVQIKRILVPKGLFFIGVHEGKADGFSKNRIGERWQAMYRHKELSRMLSSYFQIELKTGTQKERVFGEGINRYLHYFCRPRTTS